MKRRVFLRGAASLIGGLLLPACEQQRGPGEVQTPAGIGGEGRTTQTPAAIRVGPHSWHPKAREYVEAQQERRYRKLAEELGLGSDPRAAYARVSRRWMPREHVATEKWRGEFGIEPYFTREQWSQFDQRVAELYDRYASLEPPTPYEDPNRYRVMAMTFDPLLESLARKGELVSPRPLLATLASGNVNALIAEEPETGAPIIFFDHGLFQFFYDIALVTGWAVPPLSPRQLSDDLALARIPGRYTMPREASESFLDLVYAYAVDGTPTGRSPLRQPTHNLFTSAMLLTQMERFVMAHELSHVRLGHLSNPYKDESGAWEQEFEADAAGMALVTERNSGSGRSWASEVWGCDVALTALHLLDLTLGVMAYGHQEFAWISKTHPDALSRRRRLRERATSPTAGVPEVARAAASGLWRMTDAVFQRLWEIAAPVLLALRQERSARPSPLWRERIAATLTANR